MRRDLDEQLQKALDNVTEDRDVTKRLLNDLIDYISVSNERHVEAGTIAAKYVETLQRSNEQLVKISGLIHKQQAGDTGLSDTDRADIFDMLQQEEAQ